MRQSINTSAARLLALMAIPLAITVAAGTAGAQYNDQRRVDPNQQRYPSQQQRGAYGVQQRELFEWSGRVDREIRIQSDRRNSSVLQVGNNERASGRVRAMNPLPIQEGTVTIQVLEGRGKVDVVQQPTARNGYTAVIRVRDPASGVGRYRVAAYWTPTGNYDGRRRGNR